MAININDFPNDVSTNLKSNDTFDKFFYNFVMNNKRHRGIIDVTGRKWNKKDRIRYAQDMLSKAKDEAKSDINQDAVVNDIVQLYFDTIEETTYKKNRKSYYDRKVKKALGNKRASDVLPMHIQSLVNNLIKKGDAPSTAKQAVEILSPSFKIARANRIVAHNPCDDVRVKIPPQKKIVVNATDRLKKIYQAILKIYEDDPFYRAFFLLALQGRRKGEILSLRWENISFKYDYYFLPKTKNNEEQKVFLPPNVKSAMLEFNKNRGWVFESPINSQNHILDAKRQTARLKKELGDWFTMHYTRNVMVSAMAEQGVDAIYMSGALGHNDPNTITKYLTMNYMQGSKIASDMIQ